MTYPCVESNTDGGEFDGNRIFSFTCQACGSFPGVSTCSKPMFSIVAVMRDATTASILADTVITWETVSRSGTATTSSTIAGGVCSTMPSQVGW